MDPDGYGIITGSVDVPRFPPGPVPPNAEPVSLPVQIAQANSGAGPCNPTKVIKDFGTVPADGDTFKAKVNFKGGPVSPEEPTDECLALRAQTPRSARCLRRPRGHGNGYGSGSSGSGSSGPSSGGSSGSDSSSDKSSGSTDGTKVLPRTGGILPTLGAVGALLVAGGLLIRRATR